MLRIQQLRIHVIIFLLARLLHNKVFISAQTSSKPEVLVPHEPFTTTSTSTTQILEDIPRRLPQRPSRVYLPKGLLEDVRQFFIKRGSTESIQLAYDVLHSTYPEMILIAMKYMDDELFNLLLQYSSPVWLNVHLCNYGDETLLNYLCGKQGSSRRFKYLSALIDAGADLSFPTQSGQTTFLTAVMAHNTLAIDFILEFFFRTPETKVFLKDFVSARNSNGTSPIYVAIESGQYRLAHMLLDLGVNPNTKSETGTNDLLSLAIKTGSIQLVRHLLDAGADVRGLNYAKFDALSTALAVRRSVVQNEILSKLKQSSASHCALPEHDRRRSDPVNAIARLFNAMKDGMPEEFVLELLELEIQSKNRRLCSSRDRDGRNLFHIAIRYYYSKVLSRLTSIYLEIQRFLIDSGTELCCADVPDRYGIYPSEAIVKSKEWHQWEDFSAVVRFFFSIHPGTRSNSLRQVIRTPMRTTPVFTNAMEVAKLFGPQVLHITEIDHNGEDLLLQILNSNVEDTVISLTLDWLKQDVNSNFVTQRSVVRNIWMAAGGPVQRLNRYRGGGGKIQRRILTLAAQKFPVIFYYLLSTVFIGTTGDEAAYKELFSHYNAEFPPSSYSPLAHAVRCAMHAQNEILTPELPLDLLSPENDYRFLPLHYMTALEFVGNSSSTPLLETRIIFVRSNSSGMGRSLNVSRVLYPSESNPYLGIILPILGSERVSISYDLLAKPANPASLMYRKRKSEILTALLSHPKTPIHPIVLTITESALAWSFLLLGFAFIGITYPLIGINIPNDIRGRHSGWIPHGRRTWTSAFIIGIRKMFDIPRYSGRVRVLENSKWSYPLHLVFCTIITLRCLCTFYYFYEIYYIVPNYTEAAHTPGVIMTLTSPLWYLPFCNGIIYTFFVGFISVDQTMWLRWLLFGFDWGLPGRGDQQTLTSEKEFGELSIKHPEVYQKFLDFLQWKPKRERLKMMLQQGWKKSGEERQLTEGDYIRKYVRQDLEGKYVDESYFRDIIFGTERIDIDRKRVERLGVAKKTNENNIEKKEQKLVIVDSTEDATSLQHHVTLPEKEKAKIKTVKFETSQTLKHWRQTLHDEPPELPERRQDGPEKKWQRSKKKPMKHGPGQDALKWEETRYEWEKTFVYEDYMLHQFIEECGVKRGHTRDAVIATTICFLIVQFPFWRCFKQWKILNFDLYFSNAKFVSYTMRPRLTLIRELCIFVASWTQIFHIFIPLLVSLRFASLFRRVSQLMVDEFPLKEYLNIKPSSLSERTIRKYKNSIVPRNDLGFSSDMASRRQLTSKPKPSVGDYNETTKLSEKRFPIELFEAYFDVRQTIYYQLSYSYRPVHQTMYVVLFCGVCRIVWFVIELNQAVDPRRIIVDNALRFAGFQSILFIIFINWFICKASEANSSAANGYQILDHLQIDSEGLPDMPRQKILTQARVNFEKFEFRLSLLGIDLTRSRAVISVIFSFLLAVDTVVRTIK